MPSTSLNGLSVIPTQDYQPQQSAVLPSILWTAMLEKNADGLKQHRIISKENNQEHYKAKEYARTIKRAIVRANRSLPDDWKIPHWTPYQLRHTGVTELTYENDGNLDVARAVAGQRSLAIAQGYNHADLRIAIEQAKKRGKEKMLSEE